MDFGAYYAPDGSKMAEYCMKAATSALNIIKSKGYKSKLGVTPMIGINDVKDEVFQLKDAKTLLEFAKNNTEIDNLFIWSLNRDIHRDPSEPFEVYRSSGFIKLTRDFTNRF